MGRSVRDEENKVLEEDAEMAKMKAQKEAQAPLAPVFHEKHHVHRAWDVKGHPAKGHPVREHIEQVKAHKVVDKSFVVAGTDDDKSDTVDNTHPFALGGPVEPALVLVIILAILAFVLICYTTQGFGLYM